MEREQAATELPLTYQRMLEMLAHGQSEHEIADGLGIDPYAVRSMIRLAEAKLARLADCTTVADDTSDTAATTTE
ncbi:MAG TPA: hypothetical protein VFV63_15940 [Ilumatobacteraceae bacterium]|nr:hypothetical protein [Ilumatobacteraceae bacterium]